jgi:hypothetical protein
LSHVSRADPFPALVLICKRFVLIMLVSCSFI